MKFGELSFYLTEEYYKQDDICENCIEITKDHLAKIESGINRNGIVNFGSQIVYFLKMEETNFYKIGISGSYGGYLNRLGALNTASPFNISLVTYIILESGISENAAYIEKFLHSRLNPFRKKREWFEFKENQAMEVYSFLVNDLDIWDYKVNHEIESNLYELDFKEN